MYFLFLARTLPALGVLSVLDDIKSLLGSGLRVHCEFEDRNCLKNIACTVEQMEIFVMGNEHLETHVNLLLENNSFRRILSNRNTVL